MTGDGSTKAARWPVVALIAGGVTLILLLAVAVVIFLLRAGSADELTGTLPQPTEQLVKPAPFHAVVTVEASPGALPDGVDVTIGPSSDDRPPLSVGAWRSPPFTLQAGGQQPDEPLRTSIPLDSLEGVEDPTLLSLMRWDATFEVWVPVATEVSADGTMLVAYVDHLSLFRVHEWQIWEDLGRGVRLTGRQVRDLYTGTTEAVRRNGRRAAEGFAELLTAGQDLTTGWLGIGGAEPPACNELATGFELEFSHTGDERPLHACQEPGRHDDEVVLLVANNRPYGMLLEVPRSAQVRLEDWPELSLGGQAAVGTFFELLEAAFGVGAMYLPPGALGRITVDVADMNEVVIVATSTPAYTGVDLAWELLAGIYFDTAALGIDAVNCLLEGGRSFVDIIGGPDAQDVGGLFESLRTCAIALGSDGLLELVGIFRSTVATIPALASNIFDTDWSTFSVNIQLQLLRLPTFPQQPFYAVSFSNVAASVLYLVADGEVTEIGQLSTPGSSRVSLTDIAEYDGELYASSFNSLYRLDVETLVATEIGRFDRGAINSLAFTDDGRLFAAGERGNLLHVAPTTAATIQAWVLPGGHRADGDLLATPDGQLWLTTRRNTLALFDPDSGTIVNESPRLEGVSNLWGLTRDDESLIVLGGRASDCPGSGLYRIDISTSATTAVSCLSFAPGGATRPISR